MSDNNYIHIADEAPYFDDWQPDKNYKRVLFNPGVAVQARELTQLQTILQDQLSSTTSYFFKNGSPILGGKISFTTGQPYMIVNAVDADGQPIDVELLIGREFIGQTSGQRIYVISCDTEKRHIFFSYIGGELTDGESFISILTPTRTFSMRSGSVGTAITAHCATGVIYINGFNVYIEQQSKIITTEDVNARYNIGYKIDTSYITAGEDATLNDNAAGSSNFNAPGADRYQITASLYSFKGDEIPEGINFISGIVIENQKLIKEQTDASSGSALMDVLAKRTYDESGSYTVEPWKAYLYEHKEDDNKFIVSMQEGLGYINGYEVRTIISTDLTATKARKSVSRPDVNVYNTGGLYTYGLYENNVLSASKLPNFFKHEEVEVMSGKNGTGKVLGVCRIFNMRKQNNKMLIFLSDAGSILSVFSGAKSLRSVIDNTSYINIYVDENQRAVIYGQETPDIIRSGFNKLKSVVPDTIHYEVVKRYFTTSESSGNTIILSDNDTHVDFLGSEALIDIYDNNGNHVNLNPLNVLPNNSSGVSTCTITGSSIVNSVDYTVIARVRFEFMSHRAKTIHENTEILTVEAGKNSVPLAKEDIFDIISVKQLTNVKDVNTDIELKDMLTLDNGQTEHYYDLGKITGFTSSSVQNYKLQKELDTNYSVTYRYFEHDGVGPFTVNSYTSANNIAAIPDIDIYSNVPTYKSEYGVYDLRDCLDFRIKKSQISDINSTYPVSDTEVAFDSEIYLPRIDNIFVDKNGKFGIIEGIPAYEPVAPLGTADTLILYTMEVPAYVTNLNDVKLNYIDNQRYTMADISKLETRITNVEDAIAITQLENDALMMQITDENGLDKFKTGIFTDDFSDFNKCDYLNSLWNANIDSVENSLMSNFEAENFRFNLLESSQNIHKDSVIVSLPYNTEVYAQNDFASETVNAQEFMFYVWNGSVTLNPSVDTWVNDLGQKVVSTTTTGETTPPPTTFRTWSSGGVIKRTRTTYEEQLTLNQKKVNRSKKDEYMREIEVEYKCVGLRPGIKVTGWMDTVKLDLNNDIVNVDGELTGTFTVPSKMPVGKKSILFLDNTNTSVAEAIYTSNGTTVWTDVYNTYVRTYTPIETTSTIKQREPHAK